MNNNDSLRVQVSIIFLLVALVAMTTIIRHPSWFGEVEQSNQPVAHRSSLD
jgi:hypothetical protein